MEVEEIVIVGVGGAGNNALRSFMNLNIKGARCVAINADSEPLKRASAHEKLLIGKEISAGLESGGDPQIGRMVALHDADKISEVLGPKPKVVVIVAGMGGGTGTGASPVVAQVARSKGALVLAAVRLPFEVEGEKKMERAMKGVYDLREHVNTVIMLSNERLREVIKNHKLSDFVNIADDDLAFALKGVIEAMVSNGPRSSAIRSMLLSGGLATLGVGKSKDPVGAVEKAIDNILIECPLEGAKAALHIVKGASKIGVEATNLLSAKIRNPEAKVEVVLGLDEGNGEIVKAILIVFGISPCPPISFNSSL